MNTLTFYARGGPLPPVVKRKCRVCREPLKGKQRGYCSDEHRELFMLATSTKFLRARVYERDRGVCASCGEDCDDLERRVWGYSMMLKVPDKMSYRRALLRPYEQRKELCGALAEFGFKLKPGTPVSLWACDHREPLIDGGGFGLSNCQTLCVPEHIEKTSDEAGWRAKRRKLVGIRQSETMKRLKKMTRAE